MSSIEKNSPLHSRLAAALLGLHQSAVGRVVRAESKGGKKQLVIRNGLLSFAESNVPEDHLAQVLIRMGLLPRSSLPKVAALMREGHMADIAVRTCVPLSAAQIAEAGREQAISICASLLAWDSGGIREYSAASAPRRGFDLALPLPEFLLHAARRAAKRNQLPTSLRAADGLFQRVEPLHPALLSLKLEAPEIRALSLLTEAAPLEALLPLLTLAGANPREILMTLALAGMVQIAAAPTNPSAGDSEEIDAMLARSEVADFYEVLGVPRDATPEQCKLAYHDLARRYHPDHYSAGHRSPELRRKAEMLFARITGAYAALGDPQARSAYDEERLRCDNRVEAALQARSAQDAEKGKMAEALFHSGREALARGDFPRAAEHLKGSVLLRPEIGRYRHYLGVAQSEVPRLRKEAEQNLLKALELDCMMMESRLALGRLYIKVNLAHRAAAQLWEVLRWDPEHSEALKLLAHLPHQDP